VLDRLGFDMEIFGDVIRARFRRRPDSEMEERLDLVGRLMAYVRQMDMLMKDDNISQSWRSVSWRDIMKTGGRG